MRCMEQVRGWRAAGCEAPSVLWWCGVTQRVRTVSWGLRQQNCRPTCLVVVGLAAGGMRESLGQDMWKPQTVSVAIAPNFTGEHCVAYDIRGEIGVLLLRQKHQMCSACELAGICLACDVQVGCCHY